ncbi:DUF975 family protein [Lactiplantibacillus dongliensis]|uniref:DUF975 family protein n=1 Tax=Lactiplantibacillus dongliensis TaxID=2559919 RepID=A0ABW1R874_9LACO|nr:DUF975 family protein [Lactiplantibacillus dongliensis]
MKTRAALKTEIKQLFKGRWKDAILLCIVVSLLSIFSVAANYTDQAKSGGTSLTSHSTDIQQGASQAWSAMTTISWGLIATVLGVLAVGAIINFVFYCVFKLFMVGTMYSMLDWVRNPSREIHPVSDSTVGFTRPYAWPTVGLVVLQAIFLTLWSLLLIVPGIIKAFAYSQTYFVYKDLVAATPAGQPRPKLTLAITKSRQLMRGHKMEYFVLQLSFIGWALLCGMTMGIGLLWLVPYRYGTFANYYQNLVALDQADQAAASMAA